MKIPISKRVLAVYHTLLAGVALYLAIVRGGDVYAVLTTAMLGFVAYVKWEEYFHR